MHVVTVVITSLYHLDIAFCYGRFLGEFLAQEVGNEVEVAVEQPAYQSQRKHVAALQHGLVIHSAIGKTVFHHLCDRTSYYPIAVDAHLSEIVGCFKLSLLKIFFTEAVGIDDDCGLWLGILILCLQRGSVHSHQNITEVARGMHLACTDMHLETRHTSERTLWGADVGRIVWEC